jgi:hypothetical protein
MLTPSANKTRICQENLHLEDWPEWNHPNDHACTAILACVSGMPRQLRDKANLLVLQGLQGWFDESGKEGWPAKKTSPVFLLAGYVAPVRVWAKFADAWRDELDRSPKLTSLHTKDAYNFDGEFGEGSIWESKCGSRNEVERDKRLVAFARSLNCISGHSSIPLECPIAYA